MPLINMFRVQHFCSYDEHYGSSAVKDLQKYKNWISTGCKVLSILTELLQIYDDIIEFKVTAVYQVGFLLLVHCA